MQRFEALANQSKEIFTFLFSYTYALSPPLFGSIYSRGISERSFAAQ